MLRQSPCATPCGMLFEGMPNGAIDCATLDHAERYTLTQIDRFFCASNRRYCLDYACGQVFGWQVEAGQEQILIKDVWYSGTPVRTPVIGLSNCKSKIMYLAAATGWKHGAYPHEMFHIIEDCSTNRKPSDEDRRHGGGHEGWEEQGIWQFIDMFRKGEL